MSDHNIHTNDTFLKDLDEKMSKLSPIVDELDILAHQFKKLSRNVHQIDTLIMSLRSHYEDLKEIRDKKSMGCTTSGASFSIKYIEILA